MENYNTFNTSSLFFTKDKETYILKSLIETSTFYKATKTTCEGEVQLLVQGNVPAEGVILDIKEDGEFLLTVTQDNKDYTLIISHYPSIVKRIVSKLEFLLCKDCSTSIQLKPCITKEEQMFLSYGEAYFQLVYLVNIIIPFKVGTPYNILQDFITTVIRENRCKFLFLFCKDELSYKIKGENKNAFKDFNLQLLGIFYLALYYYERAIVADKRDNYIFLDNKYNYAVLHECLIKLGFDLTKISLIFENLAIPDDEYIDTICAIDNIVPVNTPSLKVFNFPVNKDISGIYDVVSLKNIGIESEIVFSSVIFNNGKISVNSKTITNPIEVDSNKTFDISILFSGKVNTPETFNISYKIGNILINTYRLIFMDKEGNTSPIISSIIKTIEANSNYTFTLFDFESHFFDAEGDMLENIEIIGDTSNFTLNGTPYISGTKINRLNINNLVYSNINNTESFNLILQWKAWDNTGNKSN